MKFFKIVERKHTPGPLSRGGKADSEKTVKCKKLKIAPLGCADRVPDVGAKPG
jgi:hypothetical protein